jgi:glycosyltransferase involved in cell wall biosynthesis
MSQQVKLSVVIITFNEQRNIARCIDSVLSVADEIVVVDSFSTDETVAIAKQKGAKVIQHKFEGHIEQKNYAITQATFPHILSLDADEMPDEVF